MDRETRDRVSGIMLGVIGGGIVWTLVLCVALFTKSSLKVLGWL